MTVLNRQTFENIKNKKFDISFEPQNTAQCELIEINISKNIPVPQGQEQPFSLIFEVESNKVYDQNTYTITNDELEAIPVFLVPISANDKTVRYEAVFN